MCGGAGPGGRAPRPCPQPGLPCAEAAGRGVGPAALPEPLGPLCESRLAGPGEGAGVGGNRRFWGTRLCFAVPKC